MPVRTTSRAYFSRREFTSRRVMVATILLPDDPRPLVRRTTRTRAPRTMPAMSRTRLAACAAFMTLAAAGTAQAAKPKLPALPVLRTYEVRISMQMQSDFSFQSDPVGCNGRLPMGYDGKGQ